MPGVADVHAKTLAGYRDAAEDGVIVGIEILSPGMPWPCPIAEAQVGTVYPLNKVPSLPMQGCERAPCCACCYSPVVR